MKHLRKWLTIGTVLFVVPIFTMGQTIFFPTVPDCCVGAACGEGYPQLSDVGNPQRCGDAAKHGSLALVPDAASKADCTSTGTTAVLCSWDDNVDQWLPASGAVGAAATFTSLTDTPGDYVGHADKLVAVNSTPDGLTFITPSSSFGVEETLDIDTFDVKIDGGSPPANINWGSNFPRQALAFDPDTDEDVYFQIKLHENLDLTASNLTFRIHWSTSVADLTGVVWCVAVADVTELGAFDPTEDTPICTARSNTAANVMIQTVINVPTSTMAVGNVLMVHLFRDADGSEAQGTDDLNADARMDSVGYAYELE